jgi:hypothetical protein
VLGILKAYANSEIINENFNQSTFNSKIVWKSNFEQIARPDDGVYSSSNSSNKCFKIIDNTQGGTSPNQLYALRTNFAQALTGKIVFEYDVRVDEGTPLIRIADMRGTNDSGTANYQFKTIKIDGNSTNYSISASGYNIEGILITKASAPLEYKKFSKIKIAIDTDSNKYNVWVNGYALISDLYTSNVIGNLPQSITELYLYSYNTTSPTWYVDNLKVYSVYEGEITSSIYEIDNLQKIISNVKFGVDVSEFKKNLNFTWSDNIEIFQGDSNVIRTGLLQNGDKVKLGINNVLYETKYTVNVLEGVEFAFYDENQIEVKTLDDVEKVNGIATNLILETRINNQTNNRLFFIILAIYNSNDKLENIVVDKKYLNNQNEIQKITLKVIIGDKKGKYIKAFAWTGTNSMIPLVKSKQLINGRSELFPEDWQPGFKIGEKFFHDFSYAGYKKGEVQNINYPTAVVTPDLAKVDPTGVLDSTAGIQEAIDAAGNLPGGAIVQLGEGTFKIKKTGQSYCLWLRKSNVVLKGAGADKTFIYNSDYDNMRSSRIIFVGPLKNSWESSVSSAIYLSQNAVEQDKIIYLENTTNLAVGDWIVIASDVTDGISAGTANDNFIKEHDMEGEWDSTVVGPRFYRKITNISGNSIEIDVPLRYWLKTRDNSRVYKVNPHIENVGIEDFSIGNLENPNDGWGDMDYLDPTKAAYKSHNSKAIEFLHVVDGFIKRVNTYKPRANTQSHILSNVINLSYCRNVTVEDCNLSNTQYQGGGGNGYGIIIASNECLITKNTANKTRHSYSFVSMSASGNVLYKNISNDSRVSLDFHNSLSMSNLIDSTTLINDSMIAVLRDGAITSDIDHGQVTTQSVIWNTNCMGHKTIDSLNYSIKSLQYGYGYVIGTKGTTANDVITTPLITPTNGKTTAPEDITDYIGNGELLRPQSLYKEQLKKRTGIVLND